MKILAAVTVLAFAFTGKAPVVATAPYGCRLVFEEVHASLQGGGDGEVGTVEIENTTEGNCCDDLQFELIIDGYTHGNHGWGHLADADYQYRLTYTSSCAPGSGRSTPWSATQHEYPSSIHGTVFNGDDFAAGTFGCDCCLTVFVEIRYYSGGAWQTPQLLMDWASGEPVPIKFDICCEDIPCDD